MMVRKGLVLAIAVFASVALLSAKNNRPKNVIIMIGDGMGFNQVHAAFTVNGGRLAMEGFPYTGFAKTYSASDYITDSAAGGTAIACGVKTKNGMVGVSPDTVPVMSILSEAEKNGLSTGIVVTCNITHATPATFYAHVENRALTEDIAAWFPRSGVDFAIGGGRANFEKRKDGRNLSEELRKSGYQVVYSMEEVKNSKNDKVLTLLAEDFPPKASEGRDYLPSAVGLAIERLSSNKKGFFLMVEGSQIDWGGHKNDQDYMVSETVDFDKAVGKALEFAKKDGNTLVIVTADHETGGTAIREGSFENKTVQIDFTKAKHTGVPIPIFAYGPGAEQFVGWLENTNYKNKLIKLLKLK